MARMDCNVLSTFGVWLSLVKRSSGGREIASSNLVTPTMIGRKADIWLVLWLFFFCKVVV